MRFDTFSPQQLRALSWWLPQNPNHRRDAVICDGAVRSGKTLCLSLSFVMWACTRFHDRDFALCGKSIPSLRRNVVNPLAAILPELGFTLRYKPSQNLLELGWEGNENRFHLFGGLDERSAALIQGVTLAGILFDEVALMPRSFVEQGLARCSVEGSKFWFNCNPGHPGHWFHTEWIEDRKGKNACYLHFQMADNPSLSPAMLARYGALYTGVFRERYVLGKWVAAQGAVYPQFDHARHVVDETPPCDRYIVSCDYGTVNPASFGLWGHCPAEDIWYRLAEYYHDSRATGRALTDEEYCDALERLATGRDIEAVVVDPSAASFIECLRRRGKYPVIPANNRVLDGIRATATALRSGKLRFHRSCRDLLREFGLYRWDLSAPSDVPLKRDDHAMDDLRYFVQYALAGGDSGFYAGSVERTAG